jgi:hypothetical protein
MKRDTIIESILNMSDDQKEASVTFWNRNNDEFYGIVSAKAPDDDTIVLRVITVDDDAPMSYLELGEELEDMSEEFKMVAKFDEEESVEINLFITNPEEELGAEKAEDFEDVLSMADHPVFTFSV